MNELTKIKLGKRLTGIESMVEQGYDHIWDCCCDHGLLGFKLLENGKAPDIHFVDIVAPLLTEIEAKLSRFYQGEKHWHLHCADVAQLPITQHPDKKHLVIIAGVGGQLLMDMLSKLLPLVQGLNVEFILSPVHHNYQLRSFLNQHQCALISETIVEENKRFYEIVHINNRPGKAISLVGSSMWDLSNADHQAYLQQTISHYQRIAKNPEADVDKIIKAYQAVTSITHC